MDGILKEIELFRFGTEWKIITTANSYVCNKKVDILGCQYGVMVDTVKDCVQMAVQKQVVKD